MSTVELICPECGTLAATESGRRSSTDFCANCDYPLFWAGGKATTVVPAQVADHSRRAPGVAGAREYAQLPCPQCHELNDPAAIVCLRCGSAMAVPEPAPAPPPPQPEPIIVRTQEECKHWPTWTVILVTASVSIVATAVAMVYI